MYRNASLINQAKMAGNGAKMSLKPAIFSHLSIYRQMETQIETH